jgi:TolB-like protein/DNA-binding winged helix-turn-helix (wHTH) protein
MPDPVAQQMPDPDDIFLFNGFRLDRRGGGLFHCGDNGAPVPVPIGQRALDVLGVLVERAGELVTRDEIIAAAWPNTVVEDNNLNMQIAALRRVLDDGRSAPSSIQTVPRRGYRLIMPVTRVGRSGEPMPLEAVRGPAPEPANQPETSAAPHDRTRLAIIAGMVGTLLLVAVAIAIAGWKGRLPWLIGAHHAPRLSIVVLPFANLSNDPGQQYFVDGITEDLTTDLSRLADILVISRDTAFTYKGKSVNTKQIGRELSVRYVLDGSVERSGSQVRINAQLIDTETDAHLWAEQFDRGIGDLLAVQSEVTGRIATALDLKLIAAEAARANEHPDALDHIFRGRAEMYKPQRSFTAAISEFEQAIALDPNSLEAQGRLAVALATRVLDDRSDNVGSDLDRADQLVERVLAKAPFSPLAHFAKAQLLRARHQCEAAIPEYEAVIATNRNSLTSIANIGRCKIYLGQIDDGIALEQQAVRLSPHDPFLGVWYFRIGQARLLQSRPDEAIRWLVEADRAKPAFLFVHTWLAAAYGLSGDLQRAAAELAQARKLSRSGEPVSIAIERTASAREFAAPMPRSLLETTYLAGLRRAGVPDQ